MPHREDQDPVRSYIPHDRLFKELLCAFFHEFLALFQPGIAARIEPSSITMLDKEIFPEGEGPRHADIVAQVATRGSYPRPFLVHVEHEAQNRKPRQFPRRMLTYALDLKERTKLDVFSLAILSYPTPKRRMPSFLEVAGPGFRSLRFDYEVVQLNELRWLDYANRLNPVAAALMCRMLVNPQDRPLVRLASLRLLARMSLEPEKTELVARFVDAYLRLSAEEEELFEVEFDNMSLEEQAAMMKLTTSWEEKGRAEERKRTEEERKRTEEARKRAEQAEELVDQERNRADQAQERAERLADRLRALGIDPESL